MSSGESTRTHTHTHTLMQSGSTPIDKAPYNERAEHAGIQKGVMSVCVCVCVCVTGGPVCPPARMCAV